MSRTNQRGLSFGLLGSKYYAQNPLVPLGKTALNLNFDMILPLGVPESVVVTGADRTTAWPAVKAAAEKNRLEVEADRRAHLGIFYRSDHFSMARAGGPAEAGARATTARDSRAAPTTQTAAAVGRTDIYRARNTVAKTAIHTTSTKCQ